MTRRQIVGSFLAAIVVFALSAGGPAAAARADDGAGQFIMRLADRALSALTDPSIDDAERAERFRELLQEGMDVPHVASRALGPYVRRATDAEMKEFEALLEENIVRKYAIMFKSYTGEQVELLESKEGRRDTELVTVQIFPTDGSAPIPMRWVVHKVDGKYKVIDIIVERVSMVTTQKEEFVSVIRRGGGKIQALLDELRERNAELAESYGGSSGS